MRDIIVVDPTKNEKIFARFIADVEPDNNYDKPKYAEVFIAASQILKRDPAYHLGAVKCAYRASMITRDDLQKAPEVHRVSVVNLLDVINDVISSKNFDNMDFLIEAMSDLEIECHNLRRTIHRGSSTQLARDYSATLEACIDVLTELQGPQRTIALLRKFQEESFYEQDGCRILAQRIARGKRKLLESTLG